MSPLIFSGEQIRTVTQAGFYLFFLIAPLLIIFRFDIVEGYSIVSGQPWMLGSNFQNLNASINEEAVAVDRHVASFSIKSPKDKY